MNAERERQLDFVIDRALAGYTAEPRPGLENRTLARLRAKEARSRAFGWRWLLSGAVAACVLLTAFMSVDLYRKHRQQEIARTQQSPPANQIAYNNLPGAARVEVKTAPVSPKAARHHAATAAVEIKPPVVAEQRPAQFPTPTPLSRQELLLAQLAQRADPKLLGTLARSSQSEAIEPLKIEPLHIAPLVSGSDSQAAPQPDSPDGPQPLNMR